MTTIRFDYQADIWAFILAAFGIDNFFLGGKSKRFRVSRFPDQTLRLPQIKYSSYFGVVTVQGKENDSTCVLISDIT